MLAEIGRMDTEMETARESMRKGTDALEAERRAHDQTRSEARESRAIAEGRLKANKKRERELRVLRNQVEKLRIEVATLTEWARSRKRKTPPRRRGGRVFQKAWRQAGAGAFPLPYSLNSQKLRSGLPETFM